MRSMRLRTAIGATVAIVLGGVIAPSAAQLSVVRSVDEKVLREYAGANIVAEKNRAAWEMALKAGGNRDYTLRMLPKANHLLLEARIGNNAEMPSLQRFVPVYFTTVREWLAQHVRGFRASR
jgi:hypothetical protein